MRDVIQVPLSPFVSAKSLMSTTHNYFRMELGIPIAKRAHAESHYVYNCADRLLKGRVIVTDAGAEWWVVQAWMDRKRTQSWRPSYTHIFWYRVKCETPVRQLLAGTSNFVIFSG